MTVSALRTLIVGSPASIYGVCPVQPMLRWPMAEPGDDLDWSLDITAPLADVADTIGSVTWSIAPSGTGERMALALAVESTVITAQLAGGVSGRNYQNSLIVTGASGRVWEWIVGQWVAPFLATYPLLPPPSVGFGTPLTWTSGAIIFPPVFIGLAVATNLVATGTNQATALPLPAQTNIFTNVPAGAGAVLNPVVGIGNYRVINASGADLIVYPPGTAQIGSYGPGNPVIVSANQTVDFATQSPTTQWYAS